jgi:hypothetical protein
MTTDLRRGRHLIDVGSGRLRLAENDVAGSPLAGSPLAGSPRGGHVRRHESWSQRHPEWPIVALLAGYPLWWALGAADFMPIVLAVPAAARMLAWRRQGDRRIRLPSGFGVWLLFLLCVLAGVAMLTLNGPDTIASPVSSRLLSFAVRAANYAAVTVLLLFAGNLTERELARRRLAWLLGLVAIYAVVGGFGGVILPNFQFTSPLALVLPQSLQANTLIGSALHPGLSQLQSVLGSAEGRPKAPFDYTNDWGNALSILVPWLLVAWWTYGTRRQRWIAVITLAAAVVPIVYSLNRGLWIGIAVSVGYLAVRMATRGKLALLGVLCAGLALVGVVILATPLQGLITSRLQHGQSDSIRSALSVVAVQDALASPVLGYGDTRHLRGSPQSASIGPTASCPGCGESIVGSTGQLWLLLVCNGILGTVLYLAFFAYGVWRYRRDTTPYGLAGVLVLLLSFFYMFTYTASTIVLAITMLSYALLWRNQSSVQAQHHEVPA